MQSQSMSDHGLSIFSLLGRVALVTGASRGIGAAIAHGLARAGAATIGLGRSSAPAQAQAVGDGFSYRACDIGDHSRFAAVCAEIVHENGRLDILVNAAGITLPQRSEAGADTETFSRTLEVNLSAAHHCCRIAAGHMRKTGGGSIINVTSVGSVLGFPGNPAYVASKGGLRMLSRALAMDYGPDRIRVNNLAPGYIHTDMTDGSYRDAAKHAERLQHMILKRWGEPSDLVGAAVFLASDASAYVTGTDIFVDGGWTAKGL